jgi:foldase protein PrsA
VLGFLISLDWELGQARAIGLKLDSEAIKIPLELLKKSYRTEAKFQQHLASIGQTEGDYLLQLKLQVLSSEIDAKVTSELTKRVHEAAIAKYYKEHELSYDTPETRDVQIVLTKTKAQATQAKREIGSGKRFRDVALRDSIDPGVRANGGLLKGSSEGRTSRRSPMPCSPPR